VLEPLVELGILLLLLVLQDLEEWLLALGLGGVVARPLPSRPLRLVNLILGDEVDEADGRRRRHRRLRARRCLVPNHYYSSAAPLSRLSAAIGAGWSHVGVYEVVLPGGGDDADAPSPGDDSEVALLLLLVVVLMDLEVPGLPGGGC
jgi:hypothetical protein